MEDKFLKSKDEHGVLGAKLKTFLTKRKDQKEPKLEENPTQSQSADDSELNYSTSRREFLDKAAGMTLATLAAGLVGVPSALGQAEPSVSDLEKCGLESLADLEEGGSESSADFKERRLESFQIRLKAAENEARIEYSHPTNGDEELYITRIGNFHKTLPHNEFGEVDPAAYDALLAATRSAKLEDFESVPQGDGGFYSNPLGGLAFTIVGPDSAAVPVIAPPSVASEELAAQAAELYWQALCRDVPFFPDWDTNDTVRDAALDLSTFPGYTGPRDPITGQVTPQVLFRLNYPGVLDGPMVSQFLLFDGQATPFPPFFRPFRIDGIRIQQKVLTPMAGEDFLTDYDEWLDIQNGGTGGNVGRFGATEVDDRYVFKVRSLGQNAAQDSLYSQYFKAVLILTNIFGFGETEPLDAANPYKPLQRQIGFSTFGLGHLLELVASAPMAERHAWYSKWHVNRFLRPEAYGGLVHHAMMGRDYPIPPHLLNNSPVLGRIKEYNKSRNTDRGLGSEGTYLLPQILKTGSPTHPSYTAGHAVTAGACVTMIKAWFDEDQEFPDPMQPNRDGTGLEQYDGPALTIGGELNKLCHNFTIGRDMSGVHWRADDTEGNKQGEEIAIRILAEETAIYPEHFEGFSLTKFDGTTITIKNGERSEG